MEWIFKKIFRGKSKFYREFMTNLIKDILWILLGLICLIGFVRGFKQKQQLQEKYDRVMLETEKITLTKQYEKLQQEINYYGNLIHKY